MEGSSRATETAIENTAPVRVLRQRAGKKAVAVMSEYREQLIAYRASMSLAESMLTKGIITEREYAKIDRIIAEKYGLSLDSICCRNPLINQGVRANMSPTNEGGDMDGKDDSTG